MATNSSSSTFVNTGGPTLSRRSYYGGRNGNTYNANYNNSNISEDYLNAWYADRKRKDISSAWFNPAHTREDGNGLRPQTIYIGERGFSQPTWEEPVYDLKAARQAAHLFSEGKIDAEEASFAPYRHSDYWANEFNEWYSNLQREAQRRETSPYRVAASGIITSEDHSALNVVNIMAEVLGRDNRTYVLEQAVSHLATPNLKIAADTWAGFGVERDVPEGVEVLTQKGKFTREEITMKKDVSHIAITDEGEITSDRNLMQEHIRHSAAEMRRTKALKIAAALETAADTAGADFAALAGEHSTTNPLDSIGALMDTIEANGGVPNTIASHNKPFRDFMSNTWIKGTITPGANISVGTRVINNVPGLPGVTWYVDNLKTSSLLTVYDKSAVLLLQGPVRTETYRDARHGFNGYLTRDWNAVWIIDTSLIADLTGVSA
jgi:hypothetical protein